MRRLYKSGLVVVALVGAGCAGTDTGARLTAALDKTASTATTVLTLGKTPSVGGTPVAVYERVARGALGCWFGGQGPLKKTHIFSADAPPPSTGSSAEISIHERETNPLPNQTPRGTRALRIWFERESEATTRVRMEAPRLPADLAEAMEKDVVAWATEKPSCEAQVVRPPPTPEPTPAKPKKRAKASPPSR